MAGSLSPSPGGFDWGVIRSTYESRGAVIYSSEWEGWVPVEDCGTHGNLGGSHFSISNLRIKGSIVQGPNPTRCAPAPPPPTPPSPPSPPPPSPPSPPAPGCPGGSLAACIHLCPTPPAAYQACITECIDRCSPGLVV